MPRAPLEASVKAIIAQREKDERERKAEADRERRDAEKAAQRQRREQARKKQQAQTTSAYPSATRNIVTASQ